MYSFTITTMVTTRRRPSHFRRGRLPVNMNSDRRINRGCRLPKFLLLTISTIFCAALSLSTTTAAPTAVSAFLLFSTSSCFATGVTSASPSSPFVVRSSLADDGESNSSPLPPPIVYTIAGSDSGGGAGIQADLHAIKAMGCHGCSAITCLTAQNSVGVTGVHLPPSDFLRQQLDTLADDLPPIAIKIGMLANKELAEVVGGFLSDIKAKHKDQKIWVVLDPVMISTSGSKLLQDDAVEAMIKHVFPLCDVLTPNKFEAEALLKRRLDTPTDVENGGRELLKLGCQSVLIKGGHTLIEESSSSSSSLGDSSTSSPASAEVQSTLQYAQDFLISSDDPPPVGDQRICDSSPDGVWLRSPRWDSDHTHGTGCTLSSSMAAALALGEQNRRLETNDDNDNSNNNNVNYRVGATSAIGIVDAACLAKAYVSQGIQNSCGLGSGPGPVAQTCFPSSWQDFPSIVSWNAPAFDSTASSFQPMMSYEDRKNDELDEDSSTPVLGRILPIVDTVPWVQRLCQTPGVTDIQLRIKDIDEPTAIADRVQLCQDFCAEHNVRLWINDHWEAAIQSGCFGVHLGQEDLTKCIRSGGINQLRSNGIALGISTHSYSELAVALGVHPSYISMGPVYATSSKNVKFDPQGLTKVKNWRELIPPTIPFVTIGGINDVVAAEANREAGSNCIAVIGAITKSENIASSVDFLNIAMTKPCKL